MHSQNLEVVEESHIEIDGSSEEVSRYMPTLGRYKMDQGWQNELKDLFYEASKKIAREGELLSM